MLELADGSSCLGGQVLEPNDTNAYFCCLHVTSLPTNPSSKHKKFFSMKGLQATGALQKCLQIISLAQIQGIN